MSGLKDAGKGRRVPRVKSKSERYCGILDIFGFEIFQHNSFEQLCINYTNEMHQQYFHENTFKLEEKIYKEEGIDYKHVEFIDNKPMISSTGIVLHHLACYYCMLP